MVSVTMGTLSACSLFLLTTARMNTTEITNSNKAKIIIIMNHIGGMVNNMPEMYMK